MPDFFASLLPSAAEAAAPAALEAAAPISFGGIPELASAGLPFAAGAGELGSVATGLGSAGVSAFADPAVFASLGSSTLPFFGELGAAGLPAAAGAGQIGAISGAPSVAEALLGTGAAAGTGVDVTGAGLTTSPASLSTGTSAPTVPQPTAAGGVTSVGPTAGTPTTALGTTGFDTAPPAPALGASAPAASGAVAPIGSAASAPTDLASTGTATAASAPSAGKSFLDNLTEGATKNAIPGAIGAGGLLYSVLKGNQQPAGAGQLGQIAPEQKALASEVTGKGKELTGYLTSGTLPEAQQGALDNAVKAAKTAAISNAASRGQPTDPTKNSVLAQELAQIDQNALTTKSQMEGQLLSSGTQLISAGQNATGLSADIYNKLASMDVAQQNQISQAIANFAKALGGTSGGVSLKLG